MSGVHSLPQHAPLTVCTGSKSCLPPAGWWAARLSAARPVGVFKANGPLHPPASALPPYSQERPSFPRSTRCVPGPLFATGTLLPTACFSPPRDVDCGRATTVSPRLAVWHKIKLEKHFLLFFYFLFFCNCRFLIAHWQFRGQYPRSVHTGILHSSLSRDCPGAAPGFSIVIIDFNLETKVTDLLELVWSMTCMLGSEVIFGELLR